MEVQFQCTLEDFLEGVVHQPKPYMWYVNWAGGIFFFFLASVETTVARDSSHAISYFFLSSVFLAWPLVIRPLSRRLNLAYVLDFVLKHVLVTGEDGLL